MGRKNIWNARILETLREHADGGTWGFMEIVRMLEAKYGVKINHKVLSDNLKELKSKEIEQTGSRYAFTEDYIGSMTHAALRKNLESMLDQRRVVPVDLNPWMQPVFILGTKKRGDDGFVSGLRTASESRFRFELKKTLEEFKEPERNRLKVLLAELLWLDHLGQRRFFKERSMKRPTSLAPNDKHLEEICSIENLDQLVHTLRKDPMTSLFSLAHVLPAVFPKIYAIIPPYKIYLLGSTVPHLDFPEEALGIHGETEQTIDPFQRKSDRELFKRFLKAVNQISFVLMVSVGNDDVDRRQWNFELASFEKWMRDLKEGRLDDREWIFSDGAANVWRFIDALKKGVVNDLLPERLKHRVFRRANQNEEGEFWVWQDYALNIDGESLGDDFDCGTLAERAHRLLKLTKTDVDVVSCNLLFLYEYHRRGRDWKFYREIYDAIDERRRILVHTREKVSSQEISIDDIL